jgi:hypothetical protein
LAAPNLSKPHGLPSQRQPDYSVRENQPQGFRLIVPATLKLLFEFKINLFFSGSGQSTQLF